MASPKTLLILFLMGATVGSFFDGFHSWSGTTFYTREWVLKMAWWTPPLFGFCAVSLGNLTVQMDSLFKRDVPPPSWTSGIGGLALLGVFYAASGFLPVPNEAILLVLTAGAAIAWALYDRSPIALLTGALVGLGGAVVEVLLIHLDLFHYTRPQFMGLPCWTMMLYVIGSITVGNLARRLEHRV